MGLATLPWLTAFLDLPADRHAEATAFWSALTGHRPSPTRGLAGQFLTLLPPEGDAHLRVQHIDDGPARVHLDVHVPDVEAATADAAGLGASREGRGRVRAMRSPGGLPFCLVGDGERSAAPAADWSTHRSAVDQLSIDVPAAGYEPELAFWSALLGREVVPSDDHAEFRFLPGRPLRILLQRLDEPSGSTQAHLDLATDDRDAEVRRHEALGARVVRREPQWTVLVDPAGLFYCVTVREPAPADPV